MVTKQPESHPIPSSEAPTFESSLRQLELIVSELESGKLGLEASLTRYEEGIKHLKSCHQLLRTAERRIELITDVQSTGKTSTQAFAEAEGTLEDKAASRSRRRSQPREATLPHTKRTSQAGDDLFAGHRDLPDEEE